MNTTKTLGSLKRVFPSWHQPLPLTQAESKKLLDTLKTSFRSSLDKEHGWEAGDAGTNANPKRRTANQDGVNQEHHAQRPTDRHLNSILSNPLFKQATRNSQVTAPARRDPMYVFDEAVSKGMMTRQAAAGCLMAKRRQILQSDSLSVHTSMADSHAGRRVVQWLRTSGEERHGAFLADNRLMKELVGFMVAEGLEEVIWSWAHSLAKADGDLAAEDPQGVLLGKLLSRLVDAKSRLMDDQSLDAAYADILRADSTWRSNPNLPTILQQPWRQLSWSSTVEAWNRPRPSDGLFEDYVHISEHLTMPVQLDLAHLDLHHPTKPSHERALDFFQRKNWDIPQTGDASAKRFTNRVASMGMDTVKHLTQIGQADQADWVTKVVRARLPQQSSGYGSIPVL
ncbi:hypothetical protein F5X68DRAFT_213560 [Plectosphaerella plurivora]|uniref:Uncharacterized protein n=1 Tax=Plectosphaerella plurivora TaxID=936078 RepID=A0A9P8V5E0_9PEZI|nr:hypothetical protein F5X68DRAFT_213560 [Plectosphaerella plurivora]